MNLNVLIGIRIKGSNTNLTFVKGVIFIKAVFTDAKTNKVVIELPVQDWNKAISALCTFLEVNGEPRENIKIKVANIIEKIINEDFAVSE